MALVVQEDILLQKITLIRDDVEADVFDLSFLKEVTYVETIDLSGPRLVLTFDDVHSIIRDDMGVRERDVIEIRIADIWGRDGVDQTIRFVIWTMPNMGDMVVMNCMQKDVDFAKRPARNAVLFHRKPAETILKRLIPGLKKYDSGRFPTIEDYHLLPGERPSRLLRQLAREKGALCFYRRGALVFQTLASLARQEVKYVYEYDNPASANQIIQFMRPNANSVIKDRMDRNIMGWSMIDGIVQPGERATNPPEFVSVFSLPTMRNIQTIPYPAIDFTVFGNGALMPGMPISLKWNTGKEAAPVDESLPVLIVAGTVAHFYSAQKYFCRIKGVLPT